MLSLPPFYFAYCTDNLSGAPESTNLGTNFTTAATGSEGTAVSLISAITHDVHFLIVGVSGVLQSGADVDGVGDVLTDPAGGTSWAEFISNLVCGFTGTSGTAPMGRWYYFPIWIPAGSSIGWRAKNTSASAPSGSQVVVYAFGEPNRPDMWWCGQGVEALGITEDTAHGDRVTPGESGAFGLWTSIGGPTTHRYGSIQMGVGPSDGGATAIGYHWEMGYGDNRLPGSPTFHTNNTTGEQGARNFPCPIWCDIPAGTQMQARGKSSGTTEEDHDIALYGVY